MSDITLRPNQQETTPIILPSERDMLPWRRALLTWRDTLNSHRTRINYVATIERLFSYVGMPQVLEDVTIDLLTAWRGMLLERSLLTAGNPERIASATVNRHLSAARCFFLFWQGRGRVLMSRDAIYGALKMVKVKTERHYAILSESEVDAFLDAATHASPITSGQDRIGRKTQQRVYRGRDAALGERDAVILTVALATGLRCDELHLLDVGSLHEIRVPVKDAHGTPQLDEAGKICYRSAWILAVHGKGNKDRTVPLSLADAEVVLAAIRRSGRNPARAADRADALFLNRRGSRLSTEQIRQIINDAADHAMAAGAIRSGKNISPHSLRHTYAVGLMRGDTSAGRRPATIVEIQKLLGHADVKTTQRYLEHTELEDLVDLAPTISRAK